MSDISINTLIERLTQARKDTLKPPPKLTLSEWADEYRFLSSEYSASPGRWRTNKAPYQREMMDAISDPAYEQVVFMVSSQLGKTEAEMNAIFYFAAQDPAPILVVMPTKDDCAAFSKTKLAPAIRDTKVVSRLFEDTKSGDTVMAKNFIGGSVSMVGAQSPSGLASKSVRILLCDEVDRFPPDAGGEGDPFSLAKQRTSNFFNRKIVAISTPTDESTSRIYPLYKESDQRKYFIKCIHCDGYFEPKWEHVEWDKAEHDEHKHLPATAHIKCPICSEKLSNNDRKIAAANGKWVKHNPDSKIAGFHTSALVSPWTTLEGLVEEWISCEKNPLKLKTFFNKKMGIPFEDRSQNVDDIDFAERVEEYDAASIPNKVAFLTAGIDTQDQRLECSVWGWGEQDESWLIEHIAIHGDTTTPVVWQELSDYLKTKFRRADGAWLSISAACIDSGGHRTPVVYEFAKRNKQRRWFAIKGDNGNRPIFPQKSSSSGQVYIVGVDVAKEMIYSRLRYKDHGAGYIHFPDNTTVEYFTQLASERKVLKTRGGNTFWKWEVKSGLRNEALDCAVYALAARKSIVIQVSARQRHIKERLEQQLKEQPKQKEQEQQSEQHTETPEQQTINKEVEAPQRREIPKWKQQLLDRKKGGRRTGGGWL